MSDTSSLKTSLEYWSNKPYQEYKEWLEKTIKLNDKPAIFLFRHIESFLSKYNNTIGLEGFLIKDKLFYLSLELKNYKRANQIITELYKEFGRENKILRMHAEINEIDPNPKSNLKLSLENYKKLIIDNQEDRESVKSYIMFMKFDTKLSDLKSYIELWNEYVKVYMDDPDGWYELSEAYLAGNNFIQAVNCLEELLLHSSHDYKIMLKIADIRASLNNVEDAKTALKFYSQSYLIEKTPRALWGIAHCIHIIKKNEKRPLDEKTKKLLVIAQEQIANLYENSPVKLSIDDVYNLSIN